MPTNSAHEWRYNALFRLLAFLDNTQLQSFDLATEVRRNSVNGEFVRPDLIFAESTPIYNILTCGLRALRANVMHLFTDDVERYAILSIIGTEGVEPVEETYELEHQELEPTEHIKKKENKYYDEKNNLKIIESDVKNEPAEGEEHVESCTRYKNSNDAKKEVVDDNCTTVFTSTEEEWSMPNNISNSNDNKTNVKREETTTEQEEVQWPTIKRVKMENEETHSISREQLHHHDETRSNWNSLPLTTAWCKSVCTPSSLISLIDTLENSFPLHLLLRLQTVLGTRSSAFTQIEETETETSSIKKKSDSDIKSGQVAENAIANAEINKQTQQTNNNDNNDKSISHYTCSYCTSSAFVEQFLIDALDYWLTSERTVAENEALILACEVQPSVLDSIKKTYHEQNINNSNYSNSNNYNKCKELSGINEMYEDFLIDVIFPLSSSSKPIINLTSLTNVNENKNSFNDDDAFNLNDWLIMCYEKNHEMTNVDDFNSDTNSDIDTSSSEVVWYNKEEQQINNNSIKKDENFYKRKRNVNNKDESKKNHKHKNVEYYSESDDDSSSNSSSISKSSDDRDANSDEIILSAENIDEYMQSSPDSIPDYIKREKRRSWLNPNITKFELEHHYTLQELRRIVKHIASCTNNTLDLDVLSKLTSTEMQWCNNATDEKKVNESVNKEPSNKSINCTPQPPSQTLHVDDFITDTARHARKKI